MWIQPNEVTLFEIKEFKSIMVRYKPDIKKKLKLFGSSSEEKIDKWCVEMYYKSTDDKNMIYTYGPSEDHAAVVQCAKSIIRQVKKHDPSIIDKAFEDAFLKE